MQNQKFKWTRHTFKLSLQEAKVKHVFFLKNPCSSQQFQQPLLFIQDKKVTNMFLKHVCVFYMSLLSSSCTHSAILLPSSRLEGCELAVKMTRPPLVWFMSLGSRLQLSPHSGSGSLGTHAALSPSCSGGTERITSLKIAVSTLITKVEEEQCIFFFFFFLMQTLSDK